LNGKLYRPCCDVYEGDKSLLTNHDQKVSSFDLWHQRLGHLNKKQLKMAISDLLAINDIVLNFCESCIQRKMHKLPIKLNDNGISSTRKLHTVHGDLCGLMETEFVGGKR